MKSLFATLTLLFCSLPAFSQTNYYFSPSTPNSTIVANLAAGTSGTNIYNFAAGTYTQAASTWVFPCVNGNVFQGVVASFTPGTGVSPTVILAPTFTGSNAVALSGNNTYTNPGDGCTVQFIAANGQNFFSYAPVSGLLFQFNKVYNIYGSVSGGGNNTAWAGFYADWTGPHVSTTQDIGYSTFQYNTFGSSCTDIDSSATDYGGTCGGIVIHGSNVNVTVANNNSTGQIEEFFHTLAQSSSGNSNGEISTNLLVQNNDCKNVHRICAEFQQEVVTNLVVQNNDFVSPYNPAYDTFGLSFACCIASAGSFSPTPTVSNNVIIQNSSCAYSYCLGYGIEAWGYNGTFNNNLLQNNAVGNNTIAFGGYTGGNSVALTAINNVFQSSHSPNGVVCEEGGSLPSCTDMTGTPVYSPNTVSSTISALTSTKPSISPAGGTYTSPQIITVSEAGSNNSVYCTTDGTTPVPDSGTTFLYTGPFSFSFTGTQSVKCVGMWGRGANPYSYPSGYGYVPSSTDSESYTASSGVASCNNASGSFGTSCYSATQTLSTNNMHSNYIAIGSQPVIPRSCTFYIGTVGQIGYHIVCGIVGAPNPTTENATPICYATYTESSSTPANSWITIGLNNCGIVAAYTPLWVFENSNDNMVSLGYSNCGSTCSGDEHSGNYGSWYVAHSYNSYSSFPSSFNGQNTWQMTNFITTTPALITEIGRRPTTRF